MRKFENIFLQFLIERSDILVEKIPTEETIYKDTIAQMKQLKTYNYAFNRLVRIYAGMVRQYYEALKVWEEEGSPISTLSASNSTKNILL